MLLLAAAGDPAVGRETYANRCGNCHFIPDTEIESDRQWLTLIEDTA